MENQEGYFNVVASDNVRSLIRELNEKGYTKDDVVGYAYNSAKSQHYVIVYK